MLRTYAEGHENGCRPPEQVDILPLQIDDTALPHAGVERKDYLESSSMLIVFMLVDSGEAQFVTSDVLLFEAFFSRTAFSFKISETVLLTVNR